MKCPKCNHELKTTSLKSVPIDECPNCMGIWFDKEELRKAKDSSDNDLRWLDFSPFQINSDKTKTELRCPKCQINLEAIEYSNSKVVIDTCPSCEGTWLDNNEFKKIISYLEKSVIKKDSSTYVKDTMSEFEEIFTGPEDMVSEIKDFLVVSNLLQLRFFAENPKVANLAIKFSQNWPIR